MQSLLERLEQGPLRSDDYAEVGVSRGSLKVRIHKLRERGIPIESRDIPGSALRRRKVEYRLVKDVCPCCGRAL